MKIVEIPLKDITPYEKNPRKNEAAVNGVAKSIAEFGFQQPIVVDSQNIIVAGHTRYKAAEMLGFKAVPCVRASELTPEQVKAYRILDNKLNELAAWDYDKLAEELKSFEFNFEDFDVYLPTFSYETYISSQNSPTLEDPTTNADNQATYTASHGTPQTQDYSYETSVVQNFTDVEDKRIRLTVHFKTQQDIVEFGRKIGVKLSPEAKICYF